MLQACLNGDRARSGHPFVPLSPDELARDARAAVAAGAGALHVHPRDAAGVETLEAEPLAAALRALRRAVPGVPVGIGTSTQIAPQGAARLAQIARWDELPDYASVNLSEPGWEAQMRALMDRGIGIEAGVWSPQDAQRLLGFAHARDCLRVLIEMIDLGPQAAVAQYQATRQVLDQSRLDLPRLLHGEGACAWDMVRLAGREGLDTRAGLEDMLDLPTGAIAPDNAAILRTARALHVS
ncbi:MAG: 3-keto-5-aminohexanoate cleavage protein [Pseudomonadota bacterium]